MNITDKLSLPLLQAPLVAFPNQAKFVAQVSNHGALGIYSTDLQTLDSIKQDIKTIKANTKAAFAVQINLADSDTHIDLADRSSTNAYLKPAYHALDIEASEATAFPDINAVCKAVVEQKPPVLIFQNGLPTDVFIEHCHRSGIIMLALASNTLEAIAIDNTLIDGIILQGLESAGVQSQFENDLNVEHYPSTTLFRQALDCTNKPLIIWGDAQTPTDCKALIDSGASGVVLDVPFWTTEESPIPASYRQALNEHNEMLTTVTHVWQGQPTRVIQNTLTQNQRDGKGKTLPAGKQQRLMAPIITAAIAQDNANYFPLWAGLCAVCSDGNLAELCQDYANAINS